MKLKIVILQLLFFFLFSGTNGQKITFNKHIAPIIEKHCTICHYKGGPTPFPLTNYEEISRKAKFISYVTEHKIMPPWKANPDYVHFKNERLMDAAEIDLIKQWVEQGSKKGLGSRKDAEYSIRNELGEPDLVLMMPEPVVVKGNNMNSYRYYKIPYEIDHDTFGAAFEFIPGNLEVLHHATFKIMRTSDSAAIFEPPFQFPADHLFMEGGGYYNALNLIGKGYDYPEPTYSNSWLPGSTVQIYPDDLSFVIPRKGVIFFDYIHYSPSPIEQKDLSGIKLYYSKSKPKRILKEILFKPNFKGLEGIIPKDSVRTIRFSKTLRGRITVFTIIPHMHRLGKYFKAYATGPSGDTIPLVEIKDWDFFWQEYYRFEEPLILESGSIIHAEAIFDNTSDNLANPSDPPIDVMFDNSMNEDSEMMHLIFLYSDYEKQDE